ncbi:ribosome recycling factor [Compostibacter hankyongensis]|uniref:Ribosome-recycling factor n=1 Tax=Compostibacter hankyongensis TaxID=1007089 RepID=A0ABP8FFH3_9BACT
MQDELELILSDTRENMQKAISHLETELTKVRAGKANPQMVDGITVEYYGSQVPLAQVANINVVDARTLSIQPWEKPLLQPIERAIIAANIGINPQNDGQYIRLFLPPLTEERRKELVKKVHGAGEQSKVSIRNIRRDAIEMVKKLQKEGLSEDSAKDAESEIQQLTDSHSTLIDKHCGTKEKEIMTV